MHSLPRAHLATQGNVLVVTLPGTDAYKFAETRALQHWVRAGNTLLILAALADAPDWATVLGGVSVGDLKVLSGLDFDKVDAGAHRAAAVTLVRRIGRMPISTQCGKRARLRLGQRNNGRAPSQREFHAGACA